MKFIITPKPILRGAVDIPASKSHTVRAAVFSTLAEGRSVVHNPLDSLDARAAIAAGQALGARFDVQPDKWIVEGVGRAGLKPPENVMDVMNSGTTLYIFMAAAALVDGWTVLTGDDQIRRRPAGALLNALNNLGAQAFSTRGNGCCPLCIRGPMRGGRTSIEAVTSQWVSAILINAPLAAGQTILDVPLLNEAPYVRMTMNWLDAFGIRYEAAPDLSRFVIPGGQKYPPFERRVAADFSSATFFFGAGAVLDADITLRGLDMNDPQGDKAVVDYLRAMGAEIDTNGPEIRVRRANLKGADLDLNATPDALPMMAVVGALAEGTTRLLNVPQARVKETDRITVMREELTRMGARIEELPDGLVIHGGKLKGAKVHGHADHRVVMALSVAGMAAQGETEIATAEAAAVTVPQFTALMSALGAVIKSE
ncbi:MAG: 3-phosphoshikimate 1-carboxyvinyltransferase [Candidatus Sumerlaeota bacterium]|nr:3-phosphoshikimate 1-carboxyvinyltransferase [Candidatus Sumerlaeota bacterium]